MRKMALVIAVLALTGCGQETSGESKKAQAPVVSAPAVAAAPQWDVLVQGETVQAISDLTGWLIEHSFVSYVVTQDGKQRVLVGPFNSKAEAEARQAELTAALAKAKKMNIESMVVEHGAVQ
ncbi:SPOR domain-containing protein [Pseudomonas sp. 6D_7.1_Bac1]|uniref:SPOR domain-containing protein n=1 Tax=Pseudomonas sp. 6D_7.1_Bac1 TaxID=2971615 RepID=UPI0021C9DB40|nr:SPOR domain-containing protein [Pseudomonas sp. 6D_7.1_Bac1]MCU1753049.1 SPOR domain-containing protein [Pseudomonas sp. 6D_7.1_Bac1]